MNVFPSKIDAWLGAVLVGLAGLVVTVAARAVLAEVPYAWAFAVPVVLVGGVLPLWLLASTRYTVDASLLRVQSGPFRRRIPIAAITRVTDTRNPLSSPALSLDRLRIEYGRGQVCLISPRDKRGFLQALRAAGAAGA